MKKHLILLFFASLFMHQMHAQNTTQAHKDSLNAIVNEYYKLNVKIFQSGSTVKDIDQVFSLFTEDFVYIHPKYGGTYTRQNLYDGYVRNQKNGGYNGQIVDIKVIKSIVGLNAVTTQKVFVKKENNATIDGEPQMTLFEFSKGKISRIIEYW